MESYTSLSNKLLSILTQAIDDTVFPGAVVGIVSTRGRIIVATGKQTYEQFSENIQDDSIYDVASVTKTVPTSLLALKLIETNRLSLHKKVHELLPGFTGKWKREVTVFHLLTHSVDFGLQLSVLKNKKPEEILSTIFTCDLEITPGTSYSYTNTTSIVLGLILENVSGRKLSDLSSDLLFEPLSMHESTFYPRQPQSKRIVPTELDPWRGKEVRGEVHDESAYVLSRISPVGSAGLFTTAPDLLNVLEMLTNNGMYRTKRIFHPDTIEEMTKNQLTAIGESAGLGWQMESDFMGKLHSPHMIGKTGFTGCFIAFDPLYKIGIVMLSNYHYPTRKKNSDALNGVRSALIDATLQRLR